jgi:Zn finger protein HypA/HybF involved in hydrogenase expression
MMVFPRQENAMWTCRHCGMSVPSQAIEPEEDSEGYYFVCPGCEGRNSLMNAGDDDQESEAGLFQPDV